MNELSQMKDSPWMRFMETGIQKTWGICCSADLRVHAAPFTDRSL